jgi:hypothetical protein
MLALVRSLPTADVAARLWRPWEDSLAEADCLHLFGTAQELLPVVEAAHRQNVAVVLSPMAWFGPGKPAAGPQPLRRKVAAWAELVGRSVCPRLSSWRRHLYEAVDLLLPNSNAEAQQIMRDFRIAAKQIRVVPYGADPRFATADPELFRRLFNLRDFVLCAGPIEPRNHQLAFLWAMHDED